MLPAGDGRIEERRARVVRTSEEARTGDEQRDDRARERDPEGPAKSGPALRLHNGLDPNGRLDRLFGRPRGRDGLDARPSH